QAIDPRLREQVAEIGLAKARADAREDLVRQAVLDALHRPVPNIGPAAALVADDYVAFDADERRDVAELPHPLGALVGDELAVGEDLKIAIGVLGQHVEQMRMHEWLAA